MNSTTVVEYGLGFHSFHLSPGHPGQGASPILEALHLDAVSPAEGVSAGHHDSRSTATTSERSVSCVRSEHAAASFGRGMRALGAGTRRVWPRPGRL